MSTCGRLYLGAHRKRKKQSALEEDTGANKSGAVGSHERSYRPMPNFVPYRQWGGRQPLWALHLLAGGALP